MGDLLGTVGLGVYQLMHLVWSSSGVSVDVELVL
jgi:hypothetical protein